MWRMPRSDSRQRLVHRRPVNRIHRCSPAAVSQSNLIPAFSMSRGMILAAIAGLQETLCQLSEFVNELVVVHVKDTMVLEGSPIEIDAVVVWRMVDGRIAEAWDIPAVHTLCDQEPEMLTARR